MTTRKFSFLSNIEVLNYFRDYLKHLEISKVCETKEYDYDEDFQKITIYKMIVLYRNSLTNEIFEDTWHSYDVKDKYSYYGSKQVKCVDCMAEVFESLEKEEQQKEEQQKEPKWFDPSNPFSLLSD